jgi:hypothetical protein
MKYTEFIKHLKEKYSHYRNGNYRIYLVGDILILSINNRRYELCDGDIINEKLIDNILHVDSFIRNMKLKFDSTDKFANTVRELHFSHCRMV